MKRHTANTTRAGLGTGLLAAVALAGSFSAAWTLTPPAPSPVTAGELAEALAVEVVPSAFEEDQDGRTHYRFELVLGSRFAKDARASYGVELVTDRGAAVMEPSKSKPFALRPRGERRAALELPSRLEDGFYELRVTAAGRSEDDAASVIRSVYLEVSKGRTELLSHDEFYGRSAANMGVQL